MTTWTPAEHLRQEEFEALRRFNPEQPYVLGTKRIRSRLEAGGLIERTPTEPGELVEWRITEAGHKAISQYGPR